MTQVKKPSLLRNPFVQFWKRVISGVLLVNEFRNFQILEINPPYQSIANTRGEIVSIISLNISDNLKEILLYLKLSGINPQHFILGMGFDIKPKKDQLIKNVENLENKFEIVANELSRIFKIVGA